VRVGIDGFGRIGRMVTRELWRRGIHRVTWVDELNPDTANAAHLLRCDSEAKAARPGIEVEGHESTLA
jgi:glyceraldehyde-3-phosphate dehydrogenase/erythrose-4-phosphate dehydrogenase